MRKCGDRGMNGMNLRLFATMMAMAAMTLAATGCGSHAEDTGEKLTVATWNVGLAYNFVPLSTERQPEAIKAAASTDADVLCLQEVWTPDDVAAMEAALEAKGFAHVYVDAMEEDTTGLPIACTAGDTQDLAPCAEKECAGSTNLVGCVQSKCGAELAAISDSCLTCLAGNLTLTLQGMLEKCGKAGGNYSWGGHHGLMLASKVPFAKKERLVLDSTLVQRAVLHGKIDAAAGRPAMEVYCTHLTAGLSSVKYTGKLGGWEQEQAKQIDAMGAWIDQTAAAGTAIVLLGDLNCGPEVAGKLTGEMPANWAKITGLGFVDAWLEGGNPTCTFCGDNNLVDSGADKGGEGSAIDHIALRGFSGGTTASRIHDGKVTITGAAGSQESSLSDHFGLRAVLTR